MRCELMIRILIASWVFFAVVVGYFIFSNKSYKNENTSLKGEIALKDTYIFTLEHSVRELQNNIAIYAKADEQAEEFNKELINDTNVDNLDVVPDDYILKQLRSD